MRRYLLLLVVAFMGISSFSQEYEVFGVVHKSDENPLPFASILVYKENESEPFLGVTTDEEGQFVLQGLQQGIYKIVFRYLGFRSVERDVSVPETLDLGSIVLKEEIKNLDETVVNVRQPKVRKEAGRLVFEVENSSFSTGNTFDLLKKTPGVLVIGENIRIKNRPTTIYINGRRVYLSPNETNSFLRNLDAAIIKSVEVITNPSAQYDSDANTILNINTTKALSPGYKGAVNGTYEQGIFPKYQFGTSHFYKNNWLNLYGSYSFSPRKEQKKDENYIRFFNPDGTTKSFWESDFTRITHSDTHQANASAEFMLDESNSLGLSASLVYAPDNTFDNFQRNEIFSASRELDSLFLTNSDVQKELQNLNLQASYHLDIGDKGAAIDVTTQYVDYFHSQDQQLMSDYFSPDGTFLNQIRFHTNAEQNTQILTAKVDGEVSFWGGSFMAGLKYSDIDTDSGLRFFDNANNSEVFVPMLSDVFLYSENIAAGYFTFEKSWSKWALSLGLRGEYTDIEGDSQALGVVNTQQYFELFPTLSATYKAGDDHTLGAAYKRSIERPRYESLNPFRYFLNENNFNQGNPNLLPSFEDKISLSYGFKNKFFIDAYFQKIDNALELLTFQDNDDMNLRQLHANSIQFQQYSLDFQYVSYVTNWWYLSAVTSLFHLESEFFALESTPLTYTNETFGFYGQLFSRLTLSKDRSWTSDLSTVYISNFISGATEYKNQFNLSFSVRKSLWNDRGSITIGVDDIFNTNNVRVRSQYFNQDNSYFARPESRLFRVGFTYSFGNTSLENTNPNVSSEEENRLK
ncbi:outer membrane beta-barrel protein [Luteirhabdus pelagi]|uniref:outer membrane beta-barrel protein n=1 Tax=Luteirhabdus pelagi TaxID=2792783 RepID=UPI00193A30D9|nr:outer membrane beta-barrel protein [Luteirhabdus pelagi]